MPNGDKHRVRIARLKEEAEAVDRLFQRKSDSESIYLPKRPLPDRNRPLYIVVINQGVAIISGFF